MAFFKAFRGKKSEMPVEHHDGYIYFTTDEGKLYIDAKQNNNTVERFLINSNNDKTAGVASNTTQNWNSNPSFVGEKDMIYIYTDYQQDQNGKDIPGIKIGDGKAYLIDSPFIDASMMNHINNHSIHITDEQREFWNNKVRCYNNNQMLIFTTL